LTQNKITTLPHPSYSRDLAPCDFLLFSKQKTHFKEHHFGTVENVQAAETRALNNISSEDFLHCYEEWQKIWNSCIRSQGAYFQMDKLLLHVCSIKVFLKKILINFGTDLVYNVGYFDTYEYIQLLFINPMTPDLNPTHIANVPRFLECGFNFQRLLLKTMCYRVFL